MKNQLKYIFIAFSLLFGATSCDETFEDINANNNEPENVTLNVQLTASQSYVFENFGWGFDRYAGAFTQHFAGNHATGVDMDQYVMNNSNFEFQFSEMYRGGFKDLSLLVEAATASESTEYLGIAKIIQAIGLGYLTDVYGDIPWSETMQGFSTPYPKYDSQQEIYNSIQTLLSEGIAELEKTATGAKVGDDDLVFQGDTDKWIMMAHVLRARYYNHLSKVDPNTSAANALNAIDAAEAAGLSASTNLLYKYDGSATHRNPWFQLYENNLIIASESFITNQINNNDPRLTAYWDDTNVDGDFVGYTGKPNGFGITNVSFAPVGENGYFGKKESPVVIATFFEAKFIEAEAALRSGDAARAAAAHNAAVTANVELYATGYGSATEIVNYTTAFANEDAGSINLEKVMTEKYKAMFTQGIEGWVDARRHDYSYPTYLEIPKFPDGTPVAAQFVRRAFYPQTELDNNTSTPLGVTQFDKVWWDQ